MRKCKIGMTGETKRDRRVLSLFSSAGIGELGIKAVGFDILLSNELLADRCALYHENYPETVSICGDIWKERETIVRRWKELSKVAPFLIYATPPCQGMSFNGIGKLMSEIRQGRRPDEDPRNRLIIPTIDIVQILKPKWVILENVPTMENTLIRTENDEYKKIVEYIFDRLGPEYVGRAEVVNCADYGMPQTRVRLITVLTRTAKGKSYLKKYGSFLLPRTHSMSHKDGLLPWRTLRDVIGKLPPLSAEEGKNHCAAIPWHIVPVMKKEKFWWVQNTPPEETAYNNQCVKCGYDGNRRHGMCFVDGIHQSKKDTPIFCERCGALLPRPTIVDKKTHKRRMIKGFDSAYRRMRWDAPAPTLTQNFQFEASDKKLHPSQNRVLSIYEGLVLQTIAEYDYKLEVDGKPIRRNMCCEVIGESVPPRLIEMVCRQIDQIMGGNE